MLHMCVIVAFRNVQLFGMRGADVIVSKCVVGKAGWLKAVSAMPKWLCLSLLSPQS